MEPHDRGYATSQEPLAAVALRLTLLAVTGYLLGSLAVAVADLAARHAPGPVGMLLAATPWPYLRHKWRSGSKGGDRLGRHSQRAAGCRELPRARARRGHQCSSQASDVPA